MTFIYHVIVLVVCVLSCGEAITSYDNTTYIYISKDGNLTTIPNDLPLDAKKVDLSQVSTNILDFVPEHLSI